MKNYLLMIPWIAIGQLSNAQSSAIFYGGIGDGLSSQSSAQLYQDFRKGSAGDGATIGNYAQVYNDMRIGGAGDGFTIGNYSQSYLDARKGGQSDGWATNTYSQDYVDMHIGGLGDGWAIQSAILPLNPLGVEFISFTGQQLNGTHILSWKTLVEKNTDYFLLEHKVANTNFIELGKVKASGNTVGEKDYNFINNNPKIGENFYRLKLVDADGKSKYSNVVLLKLLEDKTVISVYPNPTASHLNININAVKKNVPIQIIVLDMHGKITYQQSLEANNASTSIDVNSWASGTYFVRVVQGVQINTIKVVKQ
jgi:hypothetical protein